VQGSGAGRQIPVNGILQVGRDPTSGLILNDDLVSRRHLRVTADPQGLLVEDLGSRNGSFVNGVRVVQPTRLRPGDRLTVGDTILVVR
jgi:pSer/pThr/pTyr-binding forkhead associated (FHA) protein